MIPGTNLRLPQVHVLPRACKNHAHHTHMKTGSRKQIKAGQFLTNIHIFNLTCICETPLAMMGTQSHWTTGWVGEKAAPLE